MECRAWPELCTDAACQLQQLSSEIKLTLSTNSMGSGQAGYICCRPLEKTALPHGLHSSHTEQAKHGAQPMHNKSGRQYQISPTSDQMTAQTGLDEGCCTAGTVKAI